MNSRMDQILKGLLSLAVMLMLAAALIAAQARANLPSDAVATGAFAAEARMSTVLDNESLGELETLPHVLDTVLALPIVIVLGDDELSLAVGFARDGGADDSPVR